MQSFDCGRRFSLEVVFPSRSLDDSPFLKCRGEHCGPRHVRPAACQCVSLSCRAGWQSHQLATFLLGRKRKSV